MTADASQRLLERLDLRGIPYSSEAELSVLGAMMLDKGALARSLELLEPDAFYQESHREIFSAIVGLFEENSVVDPVTVSDELKSRGRLEAVGGLAYLGHIVEAIPTAANVEYHARIVLEKSILRRLIGAATEIITEASAGQQDLEEALDKAEQMIFSLSDRRLRPGFLPIHGFLQETIAQIEELREKGEHVTGLPSGFDELDRKTTGFHPGEFVVVAGRPGMGKTSLCLNVCQHIAIFRRIPVALFSLEMSKEQIAVRLLASEAQVDSNKLRTGALNEREMRQIKHAAGTLYDATIFIDDSPGLNALEMRAKARRLKSEGDLGMVIVDYLQLMEGPRSAENRQQEIAVISRSLKALAKELHVPVMALSQLSRGPERRERNRPTLADLRECLSGETLLSDAATGRRYTIREVYERGLAIPVHTLGREGVLGVTVPARVTASGRKPVFRLRTRTGRSIRASGDHPFLTPYGWREVGKLDLGDVVAACEGLAMPTPIGRLAEGATDDGGSQEGWTSWAPSGSVAELWREDRWRGEVEVGILWDAILEIRPEGEEMTYDLVIPETHNFVANELIVHNSGAIEQDADVVVFLYRDEMYNPNSPDRGIAEVIIGKNRNGPTGEVRLRFRPEITSFQNLSESPF